MRTLDPQSLTLHVDRLYRAAWALCGSREDAEDLVQDTFARVLAKRRVLHGDDELAYLLRVLRNTFFSSRRTASRRPVAVASLEDVAAADPRPTAQPERAVEAQELYAAIARLPEDFRLALVAVDIVGLSYREAAKALKAREATITTRLFRARKQVVKLMEDVAPTDAASTSPPASLPTSPPASLPTSPASLPTSQPGPAPAPTSEPAPTSSPAREDQAARRRLAEQGHL